MTRRAKKMKNPPVQNVARHQAAFLAAYVECGTILHAAKAAQLTRETHYHWLRTDESYSARFALAKDEANDMLEREARRRAIEGTKRKRFDPKNKKPYYELEYSDTMLIFLLKGNMPDKYRERSDMNVNASVSHTGQVVIQLPATEQ